MYGPPGCRCATKYWPCGLVSPPVVTPVRVSVTETWTPVNGCPVVLVTVPPTAAVVTPCAAARDARKPASVSRTRSSVTHRRFDIMVVRP